MNWFKVEAHSRNWDRWRGRGGWEGNSGGGEGEGD